MAFDAAMTTRTPQQILFLDVDGVLHPLGKNFLPCYAYLEDLVARTDSDLMYGDDIGYVSPFVHGEFCEPNMSALRYIVQKIPNIKIVLSSTWRETSCQRAAVLREMKKNGVFPAADQDFCGFTPVLGERHVEILTWLEKFAALNTIWVALDDTKLNLSPENFVQCDSALGLQKIDADKIIHLLSV